MPPLIILHMSRGKFYPYNTYLGSSTTGYQLHFAGRHQPLCHHRCHFGKCPFLDLRLVRKVNLYIQAHCHQIPTFDSSCRSIRQGRFFPIGRHCSDSHPNGNLMPKWCEKPGLHCMPSYSFLRVQYDVATKSGNDLFLRMSLSSPSQNQSWLSCPFSSHKTTSPGFDMEASRTLPDSKAWILK